jgi:riboflavin synthase
VFTGIIETTGEIRSREPSGSLVRLAVYAPSVASDVAVGDSIAVNGTCLTVTETDGATVQFDAVRETLDQTSLGALEVGGRVNLERALRASGRLDGHIVQGHVDGVGRVRDLVRDGDDVRLYVSCDRNVSQFLVRKGSVAIDGVSLTVVGVDAEGFDVALIPQTLKETTLGERRVGDRVNLEADVLGKYVKRYLEQIVPAQ